jgi:hypothetical protein
MKFIRLLREVLRLLLNKYSVSSLLLMIFLTGCQKKASEQAPVTVKPFYNYGTLLNEVKSLLHRDDGIVLLGNFKGDSTKQAAAVIDFNKKEEKISFNLIEIKDAKLEKKDETQPLEGSLKDCKIEKINLPGAGNDLIYYNSQIYFMGSNSGEVFSYLIDFKTQKTYYAHLVSEPRKPELLYISETGNQEIRKYFIEKFRKDYPAFKISPKDRILN